jgi:hypothetical protein
VSPLATKSSLSTDGKSNIFSSINSLQRRSSFVFKVQSPSAPAIKNIKLMASFMIYIEIKTWGEKVFIAKAGQDRNSNLPHI